MDAHVAKVFNRLLPQTKIFGPWALNRGFDRNHHFGIASRSFDVVREYESHVRHNDHKVAHWASMIFPSLAGIAALLLRMYTTALAYLFSLLGPTIAQSSTIGVYNSSKTPTDLPWNTYNYCNAPHVNAAHYSPPENAELVYFNLMMRHHKVCLPLAVNSTV